MAGSRGNVRGPVTGHSLKELKGFCPALARERARSLKLSDMEKQNQLVMEPSVNEIWHFLQDESLALKGYEMSVTK